MSTTYRSVLFSRRWRCCVTMKFPFRSEDAFAGYLVTVVAVVIIDNLTVDCRLIGSSNALGDGCDWVGRWVVTWDAHFLVFKSYWCAVCIYYFLVHIYLKVGKTYSYLKTGLANRLVTFSYLLNYLFIYLLHGAGYSFKSWQSLSLSNSLLSLRNPKVHDRAYKSPPLDPILSQQNPVRSIDPVSLRSI